MRFGRHTYGTFAPALLVRAACRAGGYPIYGVARKEGGLVRSVIGVLLGLADSNLRNSPVRGGRLSSPAMWAKLLVAMGLTLLTSTPLVSADPTAAQILKRVSDTYQGLKGFSFVVQTPSFDTRVAESRPGHVRLTTAWYTLVSDGAVTWVYLPNRFGDQYTEVNAAPLLDETWRVSPLGFSGWEFLRSYTRVAADGAKLEGEKVLRVNGRRIECYVVRVPVSCTRGNLRWIGGKEDLWISKSRFIVYQTVAAEPWSAPDWGCPPRLVTRPLKRMDIGPAP